ncbi:MAG: hypothetical protein KGJ59_14180 [Bacteroidota bacterium]|nr:hypothetical protein [Bacteroidota bacterium]
MNSEHDIRCKSILLLIIFSCSCAFAQLDGTPGAFSRMGSGARGMGMGNAMTAVVDGPLSNYYNPAVTPFLSERTASASFGMLSLDRSLNALSFALPLQPTAGFAISILNSGVGKIDGRDNDGFKTETYSTSENQFDFSFANKMSDKLALGLAFKIYYYHLFENISSTSLGIDIGALLHCTSELTLGIAVKDLGARYSWDSSPLYGDYGSSLKETFPMLRKIGLAYALGDSVGVVSAEVENNNTGTSIFRAGVEVNIIAQFSLRAGIDNFNLSHRAGSSFGKETTPAFGFSLREQIDGWHPALDYAYVIEPYGVTSFHMITLSAGF